MKHSPDPQEPKKWASGLSESDAFTGHDDEIRANEDLLMGALGRPEELEGEASSGAALEAQAGPRSDFRDRLKAQFVGTDVDSAARPEVGHTGGSAGESAGGDDVAMDKLRDWAPAAPSAEFENRVRGAFLDAPAESSLSADPVGGAQRHRSQRAAAQQSPSQQSTSQQSTAQQRPRARRAANPGKGLPFKLYAVGGVLAAAAALLLFFQRPAAEVVPKNVETDLVAKVDPSVSNPVESTDPVLDPEDVTHVAPELAPELAWEFDAGFGDVASRLAAVRIDGEAVASLTEFQQRMTTAERIETVGADVRIRHRDEFIMELSAGAAVRLDNWAGSSSDGGAASGGANVLFAECGSLRVATGPGFDAIASLVVQTPHVRTEVVGTIFGLDVGVGYTCVCCLEGTVRTQALAGGIGAGEVHAGRTWVADVKHMSPAQIPLVSHHRAPLERLTGYWG